MNYNNPNEETKYELSILSKEFDCLGLPTINVNVDVLDQLIASVSQLIQLYRKSLNDLQEAQIENSLLRDDCKRKKDNVDILNEKLNDYEESIKSLSNNQGKHQAEVEDLLLKLQEKERALKCAKLYSKNKESQLEHKIKKLLIENEKLKQDYKIGKYVDPDELVAAKLQKYKIKEEIYEDTIRKLQQNNDEMLGELLNLKQDILNNLRS